MRLNDDFIIVNRYTGTNDYFHLVKVVRAYKDPIHLKKHKGNTSDLGTGEVQKNEKVEILVQYIMELYTEKVKVANKSTAHVAATAAKTFTENDELFGAAVASDSAASQEISVVKTKLFMEKEISWFAIEKLHKVGANQQQSNRGRHRSLARIRGAGGGNSAAISRNSSVS